MLIKEQKRELITKLNILWEKKNQELLYFFCLTPQQISKIHHIFIEFNLNQFDIYQNLPAKEQRKFLSEIYQENKKILMEITNKLSIVKKKIKLITILLELSEKNRLPYGIFRLNVHVTEGHLIIPALGNKDSRLYVNIIEKLEKECGMSKDCLPTLANSKEGRELVLRQLLLSTRIDELDLKTWKELLKIFGKELTEFQIDLLVEIITSSDKEKLEEAYLLLVD